MNTHTPSLKIDHLHKHYHYIITGAGCAGSSLLIRMMQHPYFNNKNILVIDEELKNRNDRTWCFWEKDAGVFESIVHHQWQKVNFFSRSFSSTLNLAPYAYKLIQGDELYAFVREEARRHPNIEWLYEKVLSVDNSRGAAVVETLGNSFTADYVFNSILFNGIRTPPGVPALLQHFRGWFIETSLPSFDPLVATFMDFRVDQLHGTTFMYLMPTSANTALVEYTLFTESLLPMETYETALREYISNQLQIKEYRITHQEFGVIPMTSHRFPLNAGKVIYMGIAGGQAKGSSGYVFSFIQKRAEAVVAALVAGKAPTGNHSWNDNKFRLYDQVLLNVLCNRKMPGDEIFARIFQKVSSARVLRFLDNESGLLDDLQIMRSVPAGIFLPAALREMFRP